MYGPVTIRKKYTNNLSATRRITFSNCKATPDSLESEAMFKVQSRGSVQEEETALT
jgi:hypothetical protein